MIHAAAARATNGTRPELFYEDFAPGRVFDLGVTAIDGDEMVGFAKRFDPQWYHVDPELATASPYRGLIASGFFTVSLFMRAYVDHVLARAAADASPGLEELRWLAPAYAGDLLRGRLEVLDRRPSTAKPGLGTVTLRASLSRTGPGEPPQDVLRMTFRGWFGMRPAA